MTERKFLHKPFQFLVDFRLDIVCVFVGIDIGIHLQIFELTFIFQIFFRIFRLFLKRTHLPLNLRHNIVDTHQVFPRALKFSFRLVLSAFKLCNSRRLFKHCTALFWLFVDNLADLALPDNRIAVLADTAVEKKVGDIFKPTSVFVYLIFTFARAIKFSCDTKFVIRNVEKSVGVIECQRHLAVRKTPSFFRAFKDDVLHIVTAKRFCALFTKHPTDGVGNVTFSTPVRSHNSGKSTIKLNGGLVRKGFKPNHFNFLKIHNFILNNLNKFYHKIKNLQKDLRNFSVHKKFFYGNISGILLSACFILAVTCGNLILIHKEFCHKNVALFFGFVFHCAFEIRLNKFL